MAEDRELLDSILYTKYTDEEFFRENDVRKLHRMTINWKMIEGKWNDAAEKKLKEVAARDNLTMHEKVLLRELGYYKAKTREEKEKFAELDAVKKDMVQHMYNEFDKMFGKK